MPNSDLAHSRFLGMLQFELEELAGFLDEKGKRRFRTRLLRFDPVVHTTEPFVHDYWEEVFVISGDLIVGEDGCEDGQRTFFSSTYACRPPGIDHGPFKSEGGCLLIEFHYYDNTAP